MPSRTDPHQAFPAPIQAPIEPNKAEKCERLIRAINCEHVETGRQRQGHLLGTSSMDFPKTKTTNKTLKSKGNEEKKKKKDNL